MPEVCTTLNKEGITKITLHEGYPKVKIDFYVEKGGTEDSPVLYAYLCKVVYNDNIIQLEERTVDGLLRRLGHVLLALTEDVLQ